MENVGQQTISACVGTEPVHQTLLKLINTLTSGNRGRADDVPGNSSLTSWEHSDRVFEYTTNVCFG